MNYFRQFKHRICSILAIVIFGMSVQSAFAGVVTTTEIVDAQSIEQERDRIQSWMARDDVREQLTSLGVAVDEAQARVDNMTNEEVIAMAANMDEMPAGSGLGELIVIGALVLVILELTGVTDVFTGF